KKLPFVDIPKDDIIIPDTYDARTVGGVFPVRDQGECASGYAIASTGAVECLNFLKNGVSEELSAQEIIDCSFYYNNKGCNG
ncbi:C1 family peptidase, partial [Escherichia coli]